MSVNSSQATVNLPCLQADADLYEAIVSWTQSRCDSGAQKPALQFYNYLRTPDLFWKAAAPEFCAVLTERLGCIAELAARLAAVPRSALPARLAQWRDWADEIREVLHDPAGCDWQMLLVESAESQNNLATTCISQSLRQAVGNLEIPAGLAACLRDLEEHDVQFWQDFLLPPAAGRPYRASDYVHRTGRAEVFSRLEEVSARLDNLVLQAEGRMEDQGEGEWLAELGTDAPEKADLVCIAALNELRRTLRQADAGWPIEANGLSACLNLLHERLCHWLEASPTDNDRRLELQAVARQLDTLAEELGGCRPSSDHSAFMAVEPGAEAAGCHPADTVPGTGRSAVLAEWARKLRRAGDDQAGELARRLEQLVPPGGDREEAEGAGQRRLLSCLIYLDELAARSVRGLPWASELRDSLRKLLLADGQYVLLDQQLLGRPVNACADTAEPAGFVAGSRYPPHHIARIDQPGYAIQLADGSQQILRRAKVLLAR